MGFLFNDATREVVFRIAAADARYIENCGWTNHLYHTLRCGRHEIILRKSEQCAFSCVILIVVVPLSLGVNWPPALTFLFSLFVRFFPIFFLRLENRTEVPTSIEC